MSTSYDIVYFVKEEKTNEELRFSLRSIERNFPHAKVWFYGCAPEGIKPDKLVRFVQANEEKYSNVGTMMTMAFDNKEISENFWIFNDDFFIMKPIKDYKPYYDGDLYRYIVTVENNNDEQVSRYTHILRSTAKLLEENGLQTRNYETHTPLLVNREKALFIREHFGAGMAFRSLYGNYWKIGGVDQSDVKTADPSTPFNKDSDILSTSDTSFKVGDIGEYIRNKFQNKSRFED